MSQSAGAMRSSRTSSRRHHYQLLAPKPTQQEVQCGIYLEGRVGRPQHRSRPTPPPPGRSALVMSWTFLGSRYGPGAQGTVVNPQRERAPDQSILEDPDLIISCPWSIDGPSYIAHPISPDPISFDLTHDLAPLSPWNAWFQRNTDHASHPESPHPSPRTCPPTREMVAWARLMHQARHHSQSPLSSSSDTSFHPSPTPSPSSPLLQAPLPLDPTPSPLPHPPSFSSSFSPRHIIPPSPSRPQTSSLPSGKVTRKKPPKECPHCGAMMTHLSRHIAALHSPRSPLPCPHPGCGLSFPRKDALARHLRSSHSSSSSKESRVGSGSSVCI